MQEDVMTLRRFCRVPCAALCMLALIAAGQAFASDESAVPLQLIAAAGKSETAQQNRKKASGDLTGVEERQKKNVGKKAVTATSQSSGAQKRHTARVKEKTDAVRAKAVPAAAKSSKHEPVRKAKRKGKGGRTQMLPASAQLPQSGIASWVGRSFHGKPVANGERYNLASFTAAHLFAPFNSILKVTDLDSGGSTYVRVNDRGPYIKGRVIDLSLGAAQHLGYADKGLTSVRVELAGSDADPNLHFYVRLNAAEEADAVTPVEGFGPFDSFDAAASLLADLCKSYPQAQLVVMKEKS